MEVDVTHLVMATKRVSLFAERKQQQHKTHSNQQRKVQIPQTKQGLATKKKAEIDIKIQGENNKVAINS